MITVKGKYNEAKIFTSNIDERTKEEIKLLCDQEAYLNSVIRIMPDCHSGMGCTIGTTMTIKDKITPNLVGVDIGCGVLCVQLGDIDINFEELDRYIRNNIPHGFSINGKAQYNYKREIEKLLCYKKLGKSSEEFNRAIGSLGGGNHFIEIDKDKNDNKYLMIHTGSRNLGNRVAKYYQDMAYENCNEHANNEAKAMLINKMIDEGKEHQIQTA
ncbi:RtcB family protein [Metaclostridioides mangenotii]|uniref:RtcB family protein n=1 Tax=Metaclostridioides mangenotii TaxID=1540 RepID=UPI0028ECC286|nr:RtcB family protein [Clostridioides mangenotii]